MVLAMGEAPQAVTTAPMMSCWLVFIFGSSREDRSSGRGRNIEPPGRERFERGVEHAGSDHRRGRGHRRSPNRPAPRRSRSHRSAPSALPELAAAAIIARVRLRIANAAAKHYGPTVL